ncbi:Secreted protein [Pseudomonas brassicacearum]
MLYVPRCGWMAASLVCTTCRTFSTCVDALKCGVQVILSPVLHRFATACRIPLPLRLISGGPKKPFSVSYSFSVSTKSAQNNSVKKRGDVSIRHSAFLQPAIALSGFIYGRSS